MSQEPSVLLVDLPDQGTSFAQALRQVGRPSVCIACDQVMVALEQGRPLGIVALARDVSEIAEKIRQQNYPVELPFFVLQAEAPGSIRPPLPEVTAVVPEGVEPGILALRIQQALQQIGGPRPRQATVLGMGSMSKPQVLPSKAPSMPPSQGIVAAKKEPFVVPVSTSAGVASKPPPVPEKAPGISPTQPEVPWDDAPEPGIVSSAPPVALKSEPAGARPSHKPAVVSSAPPLPEIQALTPSAPFIPDAAPLPADVQKSIGELAQASAPPSLEKEGALGAPTHPPVALSPKAASAESPGALEEEEWGAKGRSLKPRLFAAAGLLAALGVGGVVLLRGGGDVEKQARAPAEKPIAAAPSDAGPVPGAAPGSKDAPSDAAPSNAASGSNQAADAEAKSASADAAPATSKTPEVTGEAAFYKIEAPVVMDSCEKTLGKTAADFASQKKWRASQLWKLARKNLMAGQEGEALKQMCEASFIDASSPATIGLAKYYLGQRGLEEAHAWATKAVDAASGANSKRTAQQVLGDVLSQMGKLDEARAVWLESFNLTAAQPSRLAPVVRNFINAAVKARKGGDPALAEQLLRRATTFEPDNVNASALLAATLLENGQKILAKAWAERALQKKPGLDMAEEVLKSLGG
jgi:tetratricopeptide (TPR) repeat protein